MTTKTNILIIGAGISGLMAAQRLQANGFTVKLVERSSQAGGRLATCHWHQGVFDIGAQFFTVRSARFQNFVDQWLRDNLIVSWGSGFSLNGNPVRPSQHNRYRGINGIKSITDHLAHDLDITYHAQIIEVTLNNDQWTAHSETGESFTADQMILSLPLPQSIELLETSDINLSPPIHKQLSILQYHACLTLMFNTDKPSTIPSPGGIQFDQGPIMWLADNYQKGISPDAYAYTMHAAPQFSQQYFIAEPDHVFKNLISEAKPWLKGHILNWKYHKWQYSQPKRFYSKPFYCINGNSPIYLIGDAFGGPRIEGAVMSALSITDHLLKSD